ncbi:alpha/beta hydrolase [Mycolicibacter icosiumassiliensis]|uniref:alpha/beta hydrolase n=1 Tax=Mycolicibacter icosiumassiliensis TaxID=1792835 RepID=UPI00082D95A9|nr:alpha/beta hydrolase [Mycolicibacter icosiumassiliensis]
MAFPTLSQVENASWDFLRANATAWSSLAHTWESAFTEIRDASTSPGGTPWTGAGATAFQQRAAADVVKVRGAADLLVKAAGIASRGADAQDGNKQSVLDAVNAAERQDFQVGEFFSVTDTWTYYTSAAEQEERQNEAQRHAEFITSQVHTLANNEDEIARDLTTATAGLHGFAFPDDGTDGGAGAADNHTPGPPPQDPKQFAQWWNRLTQAEKDAVYDRDHFIGNHPGMPFDDKTRYNERHMPELIANAQADVDRLQASRDQLALTPGGNLATLSQLSVLDSRLQETKHNLDGYRAVQQAMQADPNGLPRYLGYLDNQGHAAVSIGNPDTASHNAVFVPGTGADLTTMGENAKRSADMHGAAVAANPNLRAGDVSVTTWMDYDRPMSVLAQAPWPSYAQHGAGALDSFQDGMRASHVGAPSTDTVIGHSYGTTLVGAAASDGHQLAADNVIAVASPGMLVDHASDLNINPGGTVYAMTDPSDPIIPANIVTSHTLGPNPMGPDFGARDLYAGSGTGAGPAGLLPGFDTHGSYWNPNTPSLANMGAVIAGVQTPYPVGG